MKLAYIDIETGGLNPEYSPILQLAGMIEVGDNLEQFNYYIKPFENQKVDQKALDVNKLNPTEDKFEPPQVVYMKFVKLLEKYVRKYDKTDKLFFIGYNSNSFDMPFIRKFFSNCGDKYFGSYFWYPSVDVMILAIAKLMDKRHQMIDFKLGTIANAFGLDSDKEQYHSGEYDIMITREIYKHLMKG
jgi:DNA polymerase-3 subunit epsilon